MFPLNSALFEFFETGPEQRLRPPVAGHQVSMDQPALVNEQMLKFLG